MLNPQNLEINRGDLLSALEWGDGYCLSCGERVHSVEDGAVEECPSCGNALVFSGGDLLRLAAKLAPCASPYPDTL